MNKNSKGITIVEIVVSVIILGIIAAGFSAVYTFSVLRITATGNDMAFDLNCRAVADGVLSGADIETNVLEGVPVTKVKYGDEDSLEFENISADINSADVLVRLKGNRESEFKIFDASHVFIEGERGKSYIFYDVIIPPE